MHWKDKIKIFCLMKQYLTTALVVVSILLAVGLAATKWSDNAQLDTATGAINDYSNRLDTAQAQISIRDGDLLTLSNSLADSTSASLALSNQLTDAQSTIALDTEQITNLNRQLSELESANQGLGRRVMDLTNQMTSQIAALTGQIALTATNLAQANKNYALLENRLRIDVAERVVAERKFNNLSELQAQIKYLKKNPAEEISAESIYAGLDVEVKSNAFHVISPY